VLLKKTSLLWEQTMILRRLWDNELGGCYENPVKIIHIAIRHLTDPISL
jgi:hypothetical protein